MPAPGLRHRGTALVGPTVAVALLALTIALDVATPSSGPGVDLAPGFGWPYAALGVVSGAGSVVVLWRDPRQGFGWMLAVFGLLWGLDGFSQSFVRYGIHPRDAEPGINLALWVLNRFGAFLPATVAVLLLIFPTGRFLPGAWGRIGRGALTLMLLAAVAVLLAPYTGSVHGAALPPDVHLDAGTLPLPTGTVDVLQPLVIAVSVAGVLVAMASVVVRYRASTGLDRDRMRWLLWSVEAMAVVIAVSFFFDARGIRDVSILLAVGLPTVALTIAIVHPRLVAVEELLRGTFVFALVSVALLAVDLALVATLDAALGDNLDERQVVLLVLLVTAALYGPLRERIARVVRRLVLGDRAAPYDVVAGLASTLEQSDDGTEQLVAVADAVATAFGIGYVEIEVEQAFGERMVATHGIPPTDVRVLPISYRGQDVGRVTLPTHGLRTRLTRRDERLLGDLVRQAATAARTSQLVEELQDSRERLVVAREEERRRIRRDLHDGLGPALSGVVYQLDSARLQVDRDPGAAKQALVTSSAQVQDVVADVRRLVHDLRPPALDDRGLVGALTQQAERFGESGATATVVAGDLGTLPAAVEVAAYRIVCEALTNAHRHARADVVAVRLDVEDGALCLEVADDGTGIDPTAQAGVGLVSLRERATELGGRSEVVCPATGGTVVRAWLPLSTAREGVSS